MTLDEKIDAFLQTGPYAVVGASADRSKYGNKVLRCYMQHDLKVFPINPGSEEIEGHKAFPNLAALPEPVSRISVITPPEITEKIVSRKLADAGIEYIWMQPGAESPNRRRPMPKKPALRSSPAVHACSLSWVTPRGINLNSKKDNR